MNDEMREAFEANYDNSHNNKNPFGRDSLGYYTHIQTRYSWIGFQAAYQLQQKKVDELVDNYAQLLAQASTILTEEDFIKFHSVSALTGDKP